MPELPHALAAKISKLTTESVTLTTDDDQVVRWPRRLLPPDSAIGDLVHLLAVADRDTDAERQRLAKEVLREMLRGD